MKNICVITTTRADYGLLRPILREIRVHEELRLTIVASGTHLLPEYGNTIDEITNDNYGRIIQLPIIDDDMIDDKPNQTSLIMGSAISRTSELLQGYRPDIAIVYGDRYEMLAIALAFSNARIPMAHICGGETTEGLLDEVYRHCLSKVSLLHFTNCEIHRNRVIQLGEEPDRVFNVGDTAVDNIMSTNLIPKDELFADLGIPYEAKVFLITYHPVTLEGCTMDELEAMLNAFDSFKDYFLVFTGSNADFEGKEINKRLKEYVAKSDNTIFVESLGMLRYLSLLKCTSCMIGNSSSGLTEAPLFHVPTVNIGNRQKSRIHGDSVIDCQGAEINIRNAIVWAISPGFSEICKNTKSIFGDGHTAQKIVSIISDRLKQGVSVEKRFYDLPMRTEYL